MRLSLIIIIGHGDGWRFNLHAKLLVLLCGDARNSPSIPAFVYGLVHLYAITNSKGVIFTLCTRWHVRV